MKNSISKIDFLINNPSARKITLSMRFHELKSLKRDSRAFIESYSSSLMSNRFEVLCHI